MEKSYSVKPAGRVSLLILGFFVISGAWMLSSHSSAPPSKHSSSSSGQSSGQAVSSSSAAWHALSSGKTSTSTTKSAKAAQQPEPVPTASQRRIIDNPLQSGPPALSWTEGKTTYRAVHYITQWDTSAHAWIALSPDLTEDTEVGTPGYDIDGITAAAHKGASWYVGTLAGQLTVKQQNTDWTIVQGTLPMRTITAIALPLNNPSGNEAVVAYGGYGTATPSAPGHVFSTEDGGRHWHDITGNLPDKPVQSIHFLNQWASNSLVAEVNDTWYQMTRPGLWVKRVSPNSAHTKLLQLLQSWF